ncbi:MAG TPA: hypothetical protein VLC52_08300 [Anaerolineae bacterium]|nr:hypothetical protein [Anaerolineae bacterium]
MDDPLDELFWRDEILQILYWLEGEGLVEAAHACDLVTFLDAGEAVVQKYLDVLVEEGCATRVGDGYDRYRLTALGRREGGHRFAQEFAGLTSQGHGECSDPNCSCQVEGPHTCGEHAG